MKYRTLSHLLCLGILIVFLCGVYTNNAIGQTDTFTLIDVDVSSNPADGTLYEGEREIAADTKLIQSEEWDPEKVPARITYTIDAWAKGPGKVTFYLGNNSQTKVVGSWTGGVLSDGEGTYYFEVYRLNEDNYSWEDDYRKNGKPWDDECLPYLYKGYQSEVSQSTNSTLSIDGGYATYASIDLHVGGAKTKQKTLEANAGWKAGGGGAGYSSSSTKSWIYRPGDTSNDIPKDHISLSGSYSVALDDTEISGSKKKTPPADCFTCAGCGEYVHNEFAHRMRCPSPAHEGDEGLYYNCVEEQVELHKPRKCKKLGCKKWYRNCSPDDPYCNWWPWGHSEAEPSASTSPGLSPTGGSYAASPGGSHTASLTTSIPYHTVYWYVKRPWDTSYYGRNEATDSGDGITNEASFSYVFPSGAMHTGSFKITAYIYTGDNNVTEYSYTVDVQ
ncbi:hypothetical protein C6502_06725 [Candidatus Poribacteria bacterium]|nr:MAG: hypothetical protein C6502_06725 [Candidatus Poribacteria bacterium]